MTTWNFEEYREWVKRGCKKNKSIVTLDLSDNDDTGTPITSKIGNLRNLQNLVMSEHNLASVPSAICNLHKLQVFDVGYNELTSIEVIFNLCKLRFLNLSVNELTSIPSEIGNLHAIQQLDLSYNKLTTITSVICNLYSLESLNLSGNELTSIPDEIGNLHNLRTLNLSHNKLTSIPSEIGNLHTLKILEIGDNNITSIPSNIGNLFKIQTLHLWNNKLTSIPPEIGNLRTLQYFFLNNNRLTTIPAEIGNIRDLQELYINDNPIEYIPPNIRRFLDRQKRAQGVYNDAQSVHNSTIQQSIKASIMRIISITPSLNSDCVLSSILSDSTLTDFTKQSLVEYAQNTYLISEVNVTFLEVLTSVWNRVIINEHSTDIKQVLNCEMEDAECKCFTGRVSRLVNCLSGFDVLVEVKISDNEQIGNVIAVIGERLKFEGKYAVELHKEISLVELKELGYTEEVVSIWLKYIE